MNQCAICLDNPKSPCNFFAESFACEEHNNINCLCKELDNTAQELANFLVDHIDIEKAEIAVILYDNTELPLNVEFNPVGVGILKTKTNCLNSGVAFLPAPSLFFYSVLTRSDLTNFFHEKFQNVRDEEYLWSLKTCNTKTVTHKFKRVRNSIIELPALFIHFKLSKMKLTLK